MSASLAWSAEPGFDSCGAYTFVVDTDQMRHRLQRLCADRGAALGEHRGARRQRRSNDRYPHDSGGE